MGVLSVDTVVRREAFSVRARLDVADGEAVGLAGDVGSGKSTVLAAIAGVLPIETGRITCGDDVWADAGAGVHVPATARGAGYLAPRPLFPDELSGTELLGVDVAARCAELGLRDDVVARAAWTWSGGETQRIALLRAVAGDPTVLLLDDPFAALDRRTGATVRDWLAVQLTTRRGSTVLVAPDPADLARFATRVVTLG